MAAKSITRSISILRPLMYSLREPLAKEAGAGAKGAYAATSDMWKNIFLFACIPSLLLCGINVYLSEETPPPEFRPYEHLRIRTKKFPWGDGNHTLLHNPHRNALPDGYEH